MAKNLVVVESPAKAKTIKKYLGKDFAVLASYGHVRDLLPKEGAVDPANDFAMKYQTIERNLRHVDAIATAMKKADNLYLATDPDREGEAISWHVLNLLQAKNALDGKGVHRIVFHEITKAAVNAAVNNPRELAMDLVNAQQTRRALDYLVGFTLSPLLWKKIRRGLSAGRVQSPALRLIVERELEIEAFEPQEYWHIDASLSHDEGDFIAKLIQYQGSKVEQFSFTTETEAHAVRDALLAAAGGKLTVEKVEKKQRKRNPAAPFITSTLQQEAVKKLGFTARRTMRIAQQLYEGVDIGNGQVGLITYMRTDSVTLANDAIQDIRQYVSQHFAAADLPASPRVYKTKTKNAQEAHEAIRPTHVEYHPDSIRAHLTPEQFKVYDLIWRRTVACQMVHATIDTVSVDLACGDQGIFRATGSTVAYPGFLKVYRDLPSKKGSDDERLLPPLAKGDKLAVNCIEAHQHFTEPPPRYSEASLIKALEEFGIGRPSTYATIISTLLDRDYVILDNKRFKPTDTGRVVNRFLTNYFTRYVDYDFTAGLEDELDEISRGEKAWIPVLKAFWQPFEQQVQHIGKTVSRKDVTQEKLDEKCPQCGADLSIRLGKRGRFIGCTAYPECDYTRNLQSDGEEESPQTEVIEDRVCPECQEPLLIRHGRYGKFIGCSNYPKCKHMEPLEKPKDTGVTCPECHQATILERKSRRGKLFYSCARYPDCTYALWNEPLNEPCPQCRWPILTVKTTKKRGTEKVCPQKSCTFSEVVEE